MPMRLENCLDGMEIINKKNIKSFIIVIVFLIFTLSINQRSSVLNIKGVRIAGQDVKVELAHSETERERGLSGRQTLSGNEGMLFVFDQPGKYSFWMKDMNFPIDIIWMDEDLKIVYIKKDAKPELYPEQYQSDDNAKYVLEVVSGFSEKNNLKIGDSALFTHTFNN